jgi:hypothetical protein
MRYGHFGLGTLTHRLPAAGRSAARRPVAAILLDLCVRAGLDAASVDVSQRDRLPRIGYAVRRGEVSYGSAIADLCHTYLIDMTESDYKLKFVPRGQDRRRNHQPRPNSAAPPAADPSHVVAGQARGRAGAARCRSTSSTRIPTSTTSPAPPTPSASRIAGADPVQPPRQDASTCRSWSHTTNEARHIAERWLYTMWAERETYRTQTSQKYLWLDPTDNVAVAFDSGDQWHYVRVQTTDIGDNYAVALDLAAEDVTTYVISTLARGASISYVPQTITQTAGIDLLQFNVPLLQDSDDLGGTAMRIYYGGGPIAPLSNSTTATLYQSVDGASWPQFDTMATPFLDWGRTTMTLGDTVAAFATDYDNTLTFTLFSGSSSPVSCTYWDMMNGENPVLVGSEIIQFQTVRNNGDGTYTLSTLLRGRRGTEWACGSHRAGENVVFLKIGQIYGNRLPLSQKDANTLWKLVPTGRFIDSTPADSFAYRGYDLMPYAPVNAKRTLSGSNIVLTWIRRTRLGGLLMDGTDTVPLGEESEQYEVYFLASADASSFDPTQPSTYVRAYLGLTAPTLTYTAAQMTADSFDPAVSTIYAVIYQISAVVGRGFPGLHVLSAPGGGLTIGLEDGTGGWSGFIWG